MLLSPSNEFLIVLLEKKLRKVKDSARKISHRLQVPLRGVIMQEKVQGIPYSFLPHLPTGARKFPIGNSLQHSPPPPNWRQKIPYREFTTAFSHLPTGARKFPIGNLNPRSKQKKIPYREFEKKVGATSKKHGQNTQRRKFRLTLDFGTCTLRRQSVGGS